MRNALTISLIFTALCIQAQTELPTGKIEVIKDFEVRLTETQKIKIVPQPVAVDSSVRRYEYKLLAQSPAIEYLIPELKPLAINAEKKPTYYPLFVKAGYGSPNSFLGMASYDHVQNENFQWGVDYRQLTGNNKKIPLQKFSDVQARINAGYHLSEHVQIQGYLDGQIEKVYFYGAEDVPSNPESLKRRFNRFDANFQIAKVYSPETSFSYKAFLQYMTDKDDLGSSEKAFRIGGTTATAFGEDHHPLGVSLMADMSSLQHSDKQTLNNVLLEPYFEYTVGRLKMHFGSILLFNKIQNEILPDLAFSFPLTGNRMTLMAGWNGDVAKNNFQFLSSYNPYITTRLDSINNMITRRIYAGVKGASGHFAYAFTGSYTSFEGMAFFLQDESEEEQFLPVYDDGSFVGIEASIRYEILKFVFLRAQVSQRFFKLDHEASPWHRPSLGINAQVTYAGGEDKYHVSFLFNSENGLPYRTVGGTEDNLDALIDLNLHGDYYFSDSFGAFVELNNLLGNNRERWATYPSYGFNAKAGILFRLP